MPTHSLLQSLLCKKEGKKTKKKDGVILCYRLSTQEIDGTEELDRNQGCVYVPYASCLLHEIKALLFQDSVQSHCSLMTSSTFFVGSR